MKLKLEGLFKFGDEKMKIKVPCDYSYNEDLITISYNEPSDEEFEKTFTTIKIDSSQKVLISRKNNITTEMIIELNKKNTCEYKTPFGTIPLETIGVSIEKKLDQNGGTLKFQYKIYSFESETSSNEVILSFNPQT